ncbi:response regulator transcription factor [Nocardioides sp. T2.26MG-1]|uniref:response regulator transcription factor n=1 Tax=Nocardioides sp. T2.26MG-1 TaxID=3041166 RepID=UPI0024773AC3|nr:response regulator transcription factor [Nocardioides sp. T2.26MG-1]CAI9398574.1 Transcriptional regulatory protein LiaR [Nocardioides sp. T2.26MG-1]
MAHGRTRIAIIDDHELFAQSLAVALTLDGYDAERLPLGAHPSPTQVIAATKRWNPSIVLLDLDLGAAGDAGQLIGPLSQGDAVVIVITAAEDPVRHGGCIAAGAAAVLPKSSSLADIRAAVQRASARQPLIDWREREQLIGRWNRHRAAGRAHHQRFDRLTERERQVLGHLVRGRTVRDIARLGVVSEATVRTQVKSILAKLDVSSQIAAVGLAHEVGWRAPHDEP